jgi:hypothetical protein
MKGMLAGGIGLSLALLVASANAQDWRSPVRGGAAAPASPVSVTLGRPQVIDNPGPSATVMTDQQIKPASYQGTDGDAWQPVPRGQATVSYNAPQPVVPVLGQPLAVPSPSPTSSPQFHTSMAVPPPPPPDAPPFGVGPPPNPIPPPPRSGGGNGLFGYDWLGCPCGSGRKLFESDHCFDQFISPMTNTFLFLDPRSQTEVRPIYIFQTTPHSNAIYDGGDINFLGLQASVAITDRLSLIMNKFGIIWNDPKNIERHSGVSEIWLTPQFTFWRGDRTGTIAATGVVFQIPSGPAKVFQDTGTLSVVPYITVGQNFCKDFNALATFGYALGDSHRTEYFYNSYHLDWDIGGLHKIYPLIELNWFAYTSAGNSRPFFGFEGRDLINFGNNGISGADSLTLAFGARYKFNENMLTGIAFEFPLIASKDLINFRMTIDFIWRY